jgi:hypothetical protein
MAKPSVKKLNLLNINLSINKIPAQIKQEFYFHYPVKLIYMQKALLPATLVTKAMRAEVKSIAQAKLYTVKKQNNRSLLHQLFFGKQPQHANADAAFEKQWNDPNDYSSYE